MVDLTVAPEFGYVVAVAVGSYFVHHMAMNAGVSMARKKYNVKYPAMYADKDNCANEEHRNIFNCVQRGHQNSLENEAGFNVLLLLSGLRFPITSAIAGAIYVAGRFFYFKGYSTGKPDARLRGAWMYLGLLTLLGGSIRFAVELIRSKN